MNKTGLAEAPDGTTSAPKGMYRDEEQDETVARGCVRVTQVNAYDFVRKEIVKDELTGEDTDRERVIEKSRGPYFYQDSEDFIVFKENNPDARLETFGIQVLKSTAVKRMDNPKNMKQFRKGAKDDRRN